MKQKSKVTAKVAFEVIDDLWTAIALGLLGDPKEFKRLAKEFLKAFTKECGIVTRDRKALQKARYSRVLLGTESLKKYQAIADWSKAVRKEADL